MSAQGSQEWFAARLGKVTASRISDMMARTKSSGWGASRGNYMAELIAERLTGVPAEHYQSAEMKRGTEVEPLARSAYEFFRDQHVIQVGFIDHPKIAMAGASPDGLVGERGLVELKAPNTATHLDYLLNRRIPEKYMLQMQWQMVCADRDWCDFCSFDDRLPGHLQLFIKRITRDEDLIATIEKETADFLNEVAKMIKSLSDMYGDKSVTKGP